MELRDGMGYEQALPVIKRSGLSYTVTSTRITVGADDEGSCCSAVQAARMAPFFVDIDPETSPIPLEASRLYLHRAGRDRASRTRIE